MTQPTTIRRVPDAFRPLRVLDVYCCIGGATAGYQGLGWHVTGVDIQPQATDHFRLWEALPPAYTEWIGRAHLAALAAALEVAA